MYKSGPDSGAAPESVKTKDGYLLRQAASPANSAFFGWFNGYYGMILVVEFHVW